MSVRDYLRAVMTADTRGFEARAQLAELRTRLDVTPTPRFEALAAWRLLASNSLRTENASGRAAWDRANALLARALEADEPASFELASRFHAELESDASVRTSPIYAADERYLEPEDIAACIEELDAGIASATDALEAAFRAYVGIVTVHPFHNGNGRTARLTADYLLMKDAWLPLCFASPIASHVAQTYGGVPRNVATSFDVFAEGIANAYRAVIKP